MSDPKVEVRYLGDARLLRVQLDVDVMPDSLEVVCRYMGPADTGGTPVKPPKKVEVLAEIPSPPG